MREVVGQMEAEFAATDLDGDERFKYLQLAFAMFGAGDRAQDEQVLASECRYTLRILREQHDG
jgi:hypothetical protein